MDSLFLPVVRTSFLAAARLVRICRFCRGCRIGRVSLRSYIDLRAVTQLVGAVDHDAVARRQSRLNLHTFALCHPELDRADRYGVVGVDEVDERAGHAALDAR